MIFHEIKCFKRSHMGSLHHKTYNYTYDRVVVLLALSIYFIYPVLWQTYHGAPLQSKHGLQIMHIVYHALHISSCLSIFLSVYLSLSFTDCVSLVPSPAIPLGFTQLIIGRSCCRGSNSLKISLRIY